MVGHGTFTEERKWERRLTVFLRALVGAASSLEEVLAELPAAHLQHLLTAEEAALFERQGYFVIQDALDAETVSTVQASLDELERQYRPQLDVNEHERLNLLDCLALDQRLLQLLDCPTTFAKVWGLRALKHLFENKQRTDSS